MNSGTLVVDGGYDVYAKSIIHACRHKIPREFLTTGVHAECLVKYVDNLEASLQMNAAALDNCHSQLLALLEIVKEIRPLVPTDHPILKRIDSCIAQK